MNDPSGTLLVVNTNVKHELGSGEYAKRRAECKRQSHRAIDNVTCKLMRDGKRLVSIQFQLEGNQCSSVPTTDEFDSGRELVRVILNKCRA